MEIINNISIFLGEVLTFFYGLTGNYAYSIILFAIAIKLALLYFNAQQYRSMAAMQRLQPEIKKIQDKYKKDPEKLNEKMMELWKVHKVNPLSGCLPLLIQMPIIYALYRTIDLFKDQFASATFLWIGCMPASEIPKIPFNIPMMGDHIPLFGSSLATPDLPLVIIYGLSMYLSQKLTMSSGQKGGSQQTTAVVMSIFITFVMYRFQSALILYWLVFNLLTIVQQRVLKLMDENEDKKEEVKIELEETTDYTENEVEESLEKLVSSSKVTQKIGAKATQKIGPKVTQKIGTGINRKKKRKKKR